MIQAHLLRTVFLVLLFGSLITARAQNNNLLKNPGADEGATSWRAFGKAAVEECTNGPCFVIREDGYFVQDVPIPEEAAGQFVMLMGRANVDKDVDERSGPPTLYGYMQNPGTPEGGRIYAYLSGQHMTYPTDSAGSWKQLWGVFKIKPGTGRVRLFLRQSGRNASSARFDDLGVYIFPTEQMANASVLQRPQSVEFRTVGSVSTGCDLSRNAIGPLYGLRLGMTPEDVVELFSGSKFLPEESRVLELSKQKKLRSMGIEPSSAANRGFGDVKVIVVRFHEGHLISFTVEYSIRRWENADQFIAHYSEDLNLQTISKWESVEGGIGSSRYIICDGVEIRFYAAPKNFNKDTISIADTRVERAIQNAALAQQTHP